MASLKQLKDKQASVKSIHKITSAMELVSTAKSGTATKELIKYRDYYIKIEEMVKSLTSSKDYKVEKDFKGTLYVVISSDLGLAGGYNSNVMKLLYANYNKSQDKLIVIGGKAKASLIAKFGQDFNFKTYASDEIKGEDALEELTIDILEAHKDHNLKVDLIYTKYKSQIDFEATIKHLLPIEKKEEVEDYVFSPIEFEPNATTVLNEVLGTYVPSVVLGAYRESIASEHASRRVAMENATNNGEDLLKDLNIEFNKQRQTKITQELSEISAGSEALK
jgi:F-type H+-transporting ATPase subunit gamma